MKLLPGEHHQKPLMRSQHWFRKWLGAIRHQAITWTNVEPDLYSHMASIGHNGLTLKYCHHFVFELNHNITNSSQQATMHHPIHCIQIMEYVDYAYQSHQSWKLNYFHEKQIYISISYHSHLKMHDGLLKFTLLQGNMLPQIQNILIRYTHSSVLLNANILFGQILVLKGFVWCMQWLWQKQWDLEDTVKTYPQPNHDGMQHTMNCI